ncbi:MAG: TOMM precursor leader peptide-binding protein, partial [Verrucomicrobiota bacterium]
NFPTRYLSNDVAFFQKKPNIYGSIFQFEGQVSVFSPGTGGPCYRCMFPVPPKPGMVPSCAEGGVFGVLPGIVGSLQATEAIKWILGIGQPLTGRLIHLDTLTMKIRSFELRKDPQCPLCGEEPTVTELIDYDAFCGLPKEGDRDSSNVPVVTPAELDRALRAEEVVLVDVRETFEWEIARIEGSVLIPLGDLEARTSEIPADRPVVLHCKSGVRSEKAYQLLKDLGFDHLSHLEGGIDAWSLEVDDSVPRY